MILPCVYLPLHYSTMALLHSTSLHMTLPWLYLTLLHSRWFYHGSTWLYTYLYHDSTWLYFTLPWLYLILLGSTLLYHGSTSLYFTSHESSMALLVSSSLKMIYHGSTDSALLYTMTLLDSTSVYHGFIWFNGPRITLPSLYFTLLQWL